MVLYWTCVVWGFHIAHYKSDLHQDWNSENHVFISVWDNYHNHIQNCECWDSRDINLSWQIDMSPTWNLQRNLFKCETEAEEDQPVSKNVESTELRFRVILFLIVIPIYDAINECYLFWVWFVWKPFNLEGWVPCDSILTLFADILSFLSSSLIRLFLIALLFTIFLGVYKRWHSIIHFIEGDGLTLCSNKIWFSLGHLDPFGQSTFVILSNRAVLRSIFENSCKIIIGLQQKTWWIFLGWFIIENFFFVFLWEQIVIFKNGFRRIFCKITLWLVNHKFCIRLDSEMVRRAPIVVFFVLIHCK